eukprot:TRINITY_DN17530_c0_g4_i1.p1 TRINITY_DN17530_c0_g4~~TRINITY_DN17530_c0_g4_i1.p1  ORF type:complete len:166 (+),score=21.21 TRINITY_DN17530_c0_g4_i1:243-740(+)
MSSISVDTRSSISATKSTSSSTSRIQSFMKLGRSLLISRKLLSIFLKSSRIEKHGQTPLRLSSRIQRNVGHLVEYINDQNPEFLLNSSSSRLWPQLLRHIHSEYLLASFCCKFICRLVPFLLQNAIDSKDVQSLQYRLGSSLCESHQRLVSLDQNLNPSVVLLLP